MRAARRPAEPWDVEKAADLAGEALAHLAHHYPECAGSEALRAYEEAAHAAAMAADEGKYVRPSDPSCELAETRPCGYVEVRHDARES